MKLRRDEADEPMRCRASVVVVVSLLVVACTDFGTGQTTRHDRLSVRSFVLPSVDRCGHYDDSLFSSLESNRPMERWTIGPPDIRLLNQKAGAAPPPPTPHQQERTHEHPSIHQSRGEESRGKRKLDSTRLNDVILSRHDQTRLVCPRVCVRLQTTSSCSPTASPARGANDDDDNDDKA